MIPTLVIVGRPNVGKSTLFNRLTRSRDAIVAEVAGLTRDRHYGRGNFEARQFVVVDTGGLDADNVDGVFAEMARQAQLAIDEADIVLFTVDARAGLTHGDRAIADQLRRSARPVRLVANKSEGLDPNQALAEFYALGLSEIHAISAAHGEGVRDLLEHVLQPYTAQAPEDETLAKHPRVAIVGRPNVGKSTLVNALLGEERVIAYDQPGTTRDSIEIDFDWRGAPYTLIDTAGVRRRGKVQEAVEKFSVIKTLQSIEDANVAVLVVDASREISDQDASLAGYILEAGRAVVVAVNKWDIADTESRDRIKRELDRKLGFLDFAKTHYISARDNKGMVPLMASVARAYASATRKLPTPKLTKVLTGAVQRQTPPRAGLVRPKPRYAHQGGSNPPLIVVHGNALDRLPETYKRYLQHAFLKAFELEGTPVRIELRTGHNPYADRK
ncbi:MAG: ribosome biogenesis GTPase Der [Betaproteobacteria bacterium]|nr:ribosome biogenesis GTPase Der [Betaproteobacteria bacterium]